MIKTIRTIDCDLCSEHFGEVPDRDTSRAILRNANWRNLDAFDVCPACQEDLNIVGQAHPKAWRAVNQAMKEPGRVNREKPMKPEDITEGRYLHKKSKREVRVTEVNGERVTIERNGGQTTRRLKKDFVYDYRRA